MVLFIWEGRFGFKGKLCICWVYLMKSFWVLGRFVFVGSVWVLRMGCLFDGSRFGFLAGCCFMGQVWVEG